MGETKGGGGEGLENWSATPPKPEFKTSSAKESFLAVPLRELRRLFLLALAVAAAFALGISLMPREVGIIPSLPQEGKETQRETFGPLDLGFPPLADSAPRLLAAAPVEERVEKVEARGDENPGRARGSDRGARRRNSEREVGGHSNSARQEHSSKKRGRGGGQPVVAPPEEGVDVAPQPTPPEQPAEIGQGNGNGGGNGNGNGGGNGNGNGGGNGNGNGQGNGNGNGGGNGNGQGNGNGNGGEGWGGEDDAGDDEEGGSEDEGGDEDSEGEGDD